MQIPEQQEPEPEAKDYELDDSLTVPGMRTPVRTGSNNSSTLETVQEVSQPNTPGNGLDGVSEKGDYGFTQEHVDSAMGKASKPKSNNESGSESGGKSSIKMKPTNPPPVTVTRPPATKYSSNTSAGRGKPSGEGSVQTMTIETETVSSIPQVAMVSAGGGNNGSIRAKPSSETIRPKKEKKKTARKTPSVASGTGELLPLSRPKLHHHHTTREDVSDAINMPSPERRYSQGLYTPRDSSFIVSPDRSERSDRPASQLSHESSRQPSLNLYNVGSIMLTRRPASSKADIFEAKVASAVDEANSSDSEETFVYESNPPDVQDRPRRFHSRTPSATSMASQVDQRNRSMMDHGHSVAMKKSMKFANTYNTTTPDSAAGEDDGKGTARSNAGTGRGTAHHHHHIGRWGRNNGNGHASLFDNESPFPNVIKTKLSGNNQRHSSRPSSPRVSTPKLVGNGKKSPIVPYDTDDIADDERQPLMSSIRSGRSGRTRRQPSSRRWEHQASRRDNSFFGRYAGCLVLTLVIFLVALASTGFMLATTQPLSEVKVLALKNVLASEQDVIFDMKVEARNPNVVAVTIDRTNLVIFAKSKYAGTDSQYWNRPQVRRWLRWGSRKSDDDSTQTPEGDDEDPDAPTYPNLEIGHVYELESPLSFGGAPFRHARSESLGQIRITSPGNHTTPAGSERWGRVLQHEFDLIIRGTLKYTLPFSQRIQSISVEGRVTVKPNAADTDPDLLHIT